jgi:hypothetical protein
MKSNEIKDILNFELFSFEILLWSWKSNLIYILLTNFYLNSLDNATNKRICDR